ncbi:hypothetical protein SCHPADRAFT_833692 [Schizopora paradoxa]|uniref:Zn(2)-C6 fungal-type domain-containing protein n=1 Tax=Schizopora paradoxa TaxID=27342 RepID=A0A0H2RJQ6_9AGAM|nr:hypothetical protein SCHPADRAFT_833692 [Schizopora paradoxa]
MPVHRETHHTGKGQHSSNSNSTASTSANGAPTRQRETELKRLRGEISCAECRRLKLKCDKKVPCSSCTRRGCQTICPLGELLGGQGGRLVLADTDELHRTIAEMSKRIRQLEDALQIEHGMRSTDSHPLLREELLSVKKGLERDKTLSNGEAEAEDGDRGEEITCAMGLLTISEGGGARYLGATGSEQALLAEAGVSGTLMPDAMDPGLNIPEQLIQASQLWPFRVTYGSTVDLHILLESQLPSRERASGLSECFLLNMSWFSRPVTREQIMEELIPAAYKRIPDSEKATTPRMDLHDLALLFMVFAAGAAADLTLPPYNVEAERYRHLARAALGLKSVFDGGSMSAVQTICLMGTYDVASGRKHSMESAWKMMCLAFSLSASVDRDPARWHLDPKIIQRRRLLFWEMCWVDNWKSLSTGRPTSFTPDVIDCEFPEDRDAVDLDNGSVIPSLWAVKNQFAKKVLSNIAVRLCAARPPKYSEILEMDRQVREFDMQPINNPKELSHKIDEHAVFVRHSALGMFRDLVLLYIHRNYFARALLDHPENPLRSPFSPSFLAAYRSATSLLKILRHKFSLFPHVFLRHWPTWAHALAASVVVGSVVTRSPTISLAPAAFNELEQAIKLFESGSVHPIVRQGVVRRISVLYIEIS